MSHAFNQLGSFGATVRGTNRRLAAKAGGISPLYHVLVAHECSLLPSVSVPALPPPLTMTASSRRVQLCCIQ
jgi:hypothetical protein